jgi:hypothetical protein
VQESLLFAVNPVVFSDVFIQSPCSELFLFFGEPGGGSWEIGDDEEGEQGNENLRQLVKILFFNEPEGLQLMLLRR